MAEEIGVLALRFVVGMACTVATIFVIEVVKAWRADRRGER